MAEALTMPSMRDIRRRYVVQEGASYLPPPRFQAVPEQRTRAEDSKVLKNDASITQKYGRRVVQGMLLTFILLFIFHTQISALPGPAGLPSTLAVPIHQAQASIHVVHSVILRIPGAAEVLDYVHISPSVGKLEGHSEEESHGNVAMSELFEPQEIGTLETGAYILEPFTALTYSKGRNSFGLRRLIRTFRSTFESFFHQEFRISWSANSTLTTTTTSNTCWPFEGAYGTVGVHFPSAIHLLSATVHFTSSKRLDKHVGVPGKFRIWGLLSSAQSQLPLQCLVTSTDFASHLIPLLDRADNGHSVSTYPVLLSEWVDDTHDYSDTIIPFSPCSVPVDTIVIEIWGSRPSVPFTCVNRLHFVGF